MRYLILLFLSFSLILIQAQDEAFHCYHFDEAGRMREHTVDFESMVLHIDFNTSEKKVLGKVDYVFTPLRKGLETLSLDAPDIKVKSVFFNEREIDFKNEAESLILYFPETLSWDSTYQIEITYEAQPEKGLYFLGWDDPTDRARKQIWTQGQGIDNRYWVPSFDDVSDKLTTETYIRFESGYEVVSNGNLVEKTKDDEGYTTWHYKLDQPHVVYLLMIAIGEYNYIDLTSANGIVSRQYYYPDKPAEVGPTYQYSIEMMDWMEKEFGVDYPWGKIYRNVPVADFLYGAMENTTATIFTDYYLQDDREVLERNYIGTNAHELTHQWFGDLITEWSGTHHWLHESFATQYAKYFKRDILGEDLYQWDRYQEMNRAFSADAKNDLPIAHVKAGSSRHYPKGSIVIDMLRYTVGEEEYNKVITSYIEKYSFKHVDTHLFQLEFMEVLGLNLDWFFDQWIYRGGFPHYEVGYSLREKEINLVVKQIQEHSTTIHDFKATIPIEVYFADGSVYESREWIDQSMQTIKIPNPDNKEVLFVLFDAGNEIYNRLDFDRSQEELLHQAWLANTMIDQYMALVSLEGVAIDDKREGLIALYDEVEFYALKANIVKQLSKDDNKKSKKLIEKALFDEDMEVRRACILQVKEISKKSLPLFETLLKDSSFVTIDKTLLKLSNLFPEKIPSYLAMTKEDAEKNDLLAVTWFGLQAGAGDESALKSLVDYSSMSFEFRIRIKAIEKLESLQYTKADFVLNLIDASVNFNRRLASVGRNTLINMFQTKEDLIVLNSLIDSRTFDKNESKRLQILLDKFTN